jgi:hypothetical protein
MSDNAWAMVENMVTIMVIAAIVLGVYALGGGGSGFWSLIMLSNLNTNIKLKS